MKEIPILYSTPMVQAKLARRKTQTRRLIKPKSPEDMALLINMEAGVNVEKSKEELIRCSCPYGKPGDLLWGRETALFLPSQPQPGWIYKADVDNDMEAELRSKGFKWKPCIHVPKVAARIWDRVIDVRIERLQEISEEDAIAEGVESWIDERLKSRPVRYRVYEPNDDPGAMYSSTAYDSYLTLWQSLHGIESWNSNPWVWVIVSHQLSITGKPEIVNTSCDFEDSKI